MNYVYPILVQQEGDYYTASAPDLPGVVVGGHSLEELMTEAVNGCAMWLDDALTKSEPVPAASARESLSPSQDEFVSHVLIDLDEFRRKYRSRAVKKTLSLPEWMEKEARKRGFSLSQLLQDALRERLANP